jgi:hypothetical protein
MKLMNRQAELQDKIDVNAVNAWEPDTKLEIAMDALRTPPGDASIKTSGGEKAVWRYVDCCCKNQKYYY